MLQEFFSSINLSAIPCLFVMAKKCIYRTGIKGTRARWEKRGGDRPLTGSIKTRLVVRGARCILHRTPRRHRQCVVQWYLIRNNGPSSHILMVRGPYVLNGEHYIALEDPALVLESRIRMQPRGNVPRGFQHARKLSHTLSMCMYTCVCVSRRKRSIPDARVSLQMRLNFVDDKSRP